MIHGSPLGLARPVLPGDTAPAELMFELEPVLNCCVSFFSVISFRPAGHSLCARFTTERDQAGHAEPRHPAHGADIHIINSMPHFIKSSSVIT